MIPHKTTKKTKSLIARGYTGDGGALGENPTERNPLSKNTPKNN